MASFFPRPTPAFRPGQSQPSTPKRFGLGKDITVSMNEVPEIPKLEEIQRVMEYNLRNLRTPSKKTSFWKPNEDGKGLPQRWTANVSKETPSRVRGLSKQVKSRLSLKGESQQLEPNKPEMLKSPSIGQKVRTVSTRGSFAQKGKLCLSDFYSTDGLFRSTTPNDEIPVASPIPVQFRSSAASSFQRASGYSKAMDSNASSFDLQRGFNDFRISESDEAHLLGDHDGKSYPDDETAIRINGMKDRKFSDTTATQSIRTTQTVQNFATNQTNQTFETAQPARLCLIHIICDELSPKIVSVMHMHDYQPFSVGDPNLEHANPFAFIHESTRQSVMSLTLDVLAEMDISIKWLSEKKKKPLIHFDKKELSKKISRKWQRYLTMNREKRTLCEELDERRETLIKRTEEYQMQLKLVDREYNIVVSSFLKTTLIRDCGKSLIDAKGRYQKFKGYILGRTRMFYNCDWVFDHPDFETRRVNDVYYNVLPPHVIAQRRAELEKLEMCALRYRNSI
ncbi:hypothetical protein BZA77DRAFT_291829 [Pyronema omphalodes]|nr:hypothetical protein BZA77DRAFT_291829 [Pyronema omphalodes]